MDAGKSRTPDLVRSLEPRAPKWAFFLNPNYGLVNVDLRGPWVRVKCNDSGYYLYFRNQVCFVVLTEQSSGQNYKVSKISMLFFFITTFCHWSEVFHALFLATAFVKTDQLHRSCTVKTWEIVTLYRQLWPLSSQEVSILFGKRIRTYQMYHEV